MINSEHNIIFGLGNKGNMEIGEINGNTFIPLFPIYLYTPYIILKIHPQSQNMN